MRRHQDILVLASMVDYILIFIFQTTTQTDWQHGNMTTSHPMTFTEASTIHKYINIYAD